jgi:hypothetical protein
LSSFRVSNKASSSLSEAAVSSILYGASRG